MLLLSGVSATTTRVRPARMPTWIRLPGVTSHSINNVAIGTMICPTGLIPDSLDRADA
jgi:hypothetical protein